MSNAIFNAIKIGIASPDMIRQWSYGEVKKPETINYRTLKPEREGLFCEKIFGPTKDWECHCGKYKKIRYKGKICDRCGVEVTKAKVRRERMGHIELAAPCSHIWYFKGIPSRMGLLLEISPRILEKVLYFASYIVIDPGDAPLTKNQTLSEKEYRDLREKYEDDFDAGIGAEAVRKLLAIVGLSDEEAREKLALLDRKHELDAKLAELRDRGIPIPADDLDLLDSLTAEMREYTVRGLQSLSDSLRAELKDASGQKKLRIIKRLEVVEAFRQSGNDPSWMVMDVLPVIPPELRPMVQLDGGRFATSDLNDLYRRVINRNNRLERLIKLSAPDIIIRNEKRMLQEAVDALIDNGRRGRAVTGANNRALKSLSDMLKGKQGRFRQNLLGKRVDYSGRSVIVVGPELKLYQCGLPKEMAIELFRPFVMKKLVEDGQANNIKSAKKMIDKGKTEVWDALEEIIKDRPVMLNRAPTLHRLGIQAFEPVLVEGRAIKLHPLCCTAFNADFDGDQMAVHVPLSAEAQAEARMLMLSANNLLRPQDGKPVTVPTQDMILGTYYLTYVKEDEKGAGHCFSSVDEVMLAYKDHILEMHAPIKVRMEKEIDGIVKSQIIDATVGQLIFNEPIPQDLGFKKRETEDEMFALEITDTVGKKLLSKIIDRCIRVHGFTIATEMLDKVKALGYKYSTRGAITVSIADMSIPERKYELIHEAEDEVVKIDRQFKRGNITNDERYRLTVKQWEKTIKDVTDALQDNLDRFNPIFMMADSGARGSMKQIRQLAGMRGMMADTNGRTIEIPVKANFREGLSVLEYFISSRGARKGLTDTALRTADSGYLTRRLVDVSQDVIIRERDCRTGNGIWLGAIKEKTKKPTKTYGQRINGRFLVKDLYDAEGNLLQSRDVEMTEDDAARFEAAGVMSVYCRPDSQKSDGGCIWLGTDLADEEEEKIIESFGQRIQGRFLVDDLFDEEGNLIQSCDVMMTEADAERFSALGIQRVYCRTVLGCKARSGVCAKCYGMNLATSNLVDLGEAVGIIAAQSIGEPGTQLTMRTFHTGGVAGDDITQGLPRVEELFEARKPKKMATISEITGTVDVDDSHRTALRQITVTADDGEVKLYQVPYSAGLRVVNGGRVNKGDRITDGALSPHDVLRISGVEAVQEYLTQEVLAVYRQQGVDINDKHIEVIIRQMMRKVRVEDAGDTELLSGTVIDSFEFDDANDAVQARIDAGETDLRLATKSLILMGITKASLATDSFLSAASFQETTKVLTEAAIKGKVDRLVGLKENVIIGKLIPAGSGLQVYRDYEEGLTPESRVTSDMLDNEQLQ